MQFLTGHFTIAASLWRHRHSPKTVVYVTIIASICSIIITNIFHYCEKWDYYFH